MKAVFFRMRAQTYGNADPELPGIHFHHRRTVSAPADPVNYPRQFIGYPRRDKRYTVIKTVQPFHDQTQK